MTNLQTHKLISNKSLTELSKGDDYDSFHSRTLDEAMVQVSVFKGNFDKDSFLVYIDGLLMGWTSLPDVAFSFVNNSSIYEKDEVVNALYYCRELK